MKELNARIYPCVSICYSFPIPFVQDTVLYLQNFPEAFCTVFPNKAKRTVDPKGF
jgi:hypothetical protein